MYTSINVREYRLIIAKHKMKYDVDEAEKR